MKIAVLSGKGGTGKTTVALCMAYSLKNSQYVDCDVEEPNGYIFFKPKIVEVVDVNVKVPKVDSGKCTLCGECAKVCQFNAIAVVKHGVMVFDKLCHHCGACKIICPEDAVIHENKKIGVIEINSDKTFLQGRLNISEPVSIPILKEIKNYYRNGNSSPVIIDCAPGATCGNVETIDGIDYCILVTEPNPFGLYDLKIAVELLNMQNKRYGVIINKTQKGINIINDFCSLKKIDILLEIPFSEKTASDYSKGILPVQNNSELIKKFIKMYKNIEGSLIHETDSIC